MRHKVVGFLQVYNEIRKGNLHRFVNHIFQHVDEVVVYDNGSTDGTYELLYSRTPHIIRGCKNEFYNEIHKKQKLLELALSLNPDFILWLDCDEVLAKGLDVQYICTKMIDMKVDGVGLPEINLWLSKRWKRVDNLYADGIFVRLWRIDKNKSIYFPLENGLHKRQYPAGIEHVVNIMDCPVIHYGFSDYNNLAHKFFTYRRYGQRGYPLLRILSEDEKDNSLKVEKVDESIFPVDLLTDYEKPIVHSFKTQMNEIYKYKEIVDKPNVSFICLIYKSVKWAEFLYTQFLKYTDITNHEFFFVANDPGLDVLQYLENRHIPHYVYRSPKPEEFYINNVYRAYNYGAEMAKGDYILFLNSDMAFSEGWFDRLFVKLTPSNCVTSRLVERGKWKSGQWGVERSFGNTPEDYDEQSFIEYSKDLKIDDLVLDGGLFMPLLIRRDDFTQIGGYPEGNIIPNSDIFTPTISLKGQPCVSGDVVLMKKLESRGIKHQTVFDSIVYHFQQGETDDKSQDIINSCSPIVICNDYVKGRNGEKVLWEFLLEDIENTTKVDLDTLNYPRSSDWESKIGEYIKSNLSPSYIFQNASFMRLVDENTPSVVYLQDNFINLGYNTEEQFNNLNKSKFIIGNSISIASSYPEYDVDVIPIGVDHQLFSPSNKITSRIKHNLPINRKIGIFVGEFNTIKGFEKLKNVIVLNPRIYWILVSKNADDKVADNYNIKIYNKISQNLLVDLLSASDFYINTSPEESLCLAAVEAAMCNIPLIMYEVGFLVGLDVKYKNKLWIDLKSIREEEIQDITFSGFCPRDIILELGYSKEEVMKRWKSKFRDIQLKLDWSKKYKF